MHKELDSWEESWPTQILAETLWLRESWAGGIILVSLFLKEGSHHLLYILPGCLGNFFKHLVVVKTPVTWVFARHLESTWSSTSSPLEGQCVGHSLLGQLTARYRDERTGAPSQGRYRWATEWCGVWVRYPAFLGLRA